MRILLVLLMLLPCSIAKDAMVFKSGVNTNRFGAFKVARMRRMTDGYDSGAVEGDENDEPENLNTTTAIPDGNTTTYAPIIKLLSVEMLFRDVDLDAIENIEAFTYSLNHTLVQLGQLDQDDIFNITLSAGSVVADVMVSTYEAKEAVDTLLYAGMVAFEYGEQILVAETASSTTSSTHTTVTTRTNTTTTTTRTTTHRPTAAPVSPFAGNVADLTEVKLYLAAGISGFVSVLTFFVLFASCLRDTYRNMKARSTGRETYYDKYSPSRPTGSIPESASRSSSSGGFRSPRKRLGYGTAAGGGGSGGGGGGSGGAGAGGDGSNAAANIHRSKSVSFHHGHRPTLSSNKSLPAEWHAEDEQRHQIANEVGMGSMPSFNQFVPGMSQPRPGSNPLSVPGNTSFGGSSDPSQDPSNLDAVSRSILTHIAAQEDRLQQLEIKIRGTRVSSETNMSQEERMKELEEACNTPYDAPTVIAGGQALELTPVSSVSSVVDESAEGRRSSTPSPHAAGRDNDNGFEPVQFSGAAAVPRPDNVGDSGSTGLITVQPSSIEAEHAYDGVPIVASIPTPPTAAAVAVADMGDGSAITVTTPSGNIVHIEDNSGETVL